MVNIPSSYDQSHAPHHPKQPPGTHVPTDPHRRTPGHRMRPHPGRGRRRRPHPRVDHHHLPVRPKAPDRCTPQMLHSTSTYRLKLSDGTTTRWHTVPEGDYHQCPVGTQYPTCARGESHGDTAWTTLNSSDK